MANPVETKTRSTGVWARHTRSCSIARGGTRCSCGPAGYIARVRIDGRLYGSGVRRTEAEARNWRADAPARLARGEALTAGTATIADMIESFRAALHDGVVTNKKRKTYKPSAERDVLQALDGRISDRFGTTPVDRLRRREWQAWLDELYRGGLSGSRIRTLHYALVALYRYARQRHDVENLPTAGIDLPPMDETRRGWGTPGTVPSPRQLDALLAALPARDRVPFAIAAWTSARKQEILNLDWPHVDFELEQLVLADSEDYGKSVAANRVVPMVPTLTALLRQEWMRQGRPRDGLVCRPYRPGSRRGLLSVESLYARCDRRWQDAGLTPLRLHVARHACASYLRAAGVDLKVRSAILGHASTSSLSMTEDRYTHLMPDDVAKAKRALAAYLATGTEGA